MKDTVTGWQQILNDYERVVFSNLGTFNSYFVCLNMTKKLLILSIIKDTFKDYRWSQYGLKCMRSLND